MSDNMNFSDRTNTSSSSTRENRNHETSSLGSKVIKWVGIVMVVILLIILIYTVVSTQLISTRDLFTKINFPYKLEYEPTYTPVDYFDINKFDIQSFSPYSDYDDTRSTFYSLATVIEQWAITQKNNWKADLMIISFLVQINSGTQLAPRDRVIENNKNLSQAHLMLVRILDYYINNYNNRFSKYKESFDIQTSLNFLDSIVKEEGNEILLYNVQLTKPEVLSICMNLQGRCPNAVTSKLKTVFDHWSKIDITHATDGYFYIDGGIVNRQSIDQGMIKNIYVNVGKHDKKLGEILYQKLYGMVHESFNIGCLPGMVDSDNHEMLYRTPFISNGPKHTTNKIYVFPSIKYMTYFTPKASFACKGLSSQIKLFTTPDDSDVATKCIPEFYSTFECKRLIHYTDTYDRMALPMEGSLDTDPPIAVVPGKILHMTTISFSVVFTYENFGVMAQSYTVPPNLFDTSVQYSMIEFVIIDSKADTIEVHNSLTFQKGTIKVYNPQTKTSVELTAGKANEYMYNLNDSTFSQTPFTKYDASTQILTLDSSLILDMSNSNFFIVRKNNEPVIFIPWRTNTDIGYVTLLDAKGVSTDYLITFDHTVNQYTLAKA